jgi:phage terminase large subunit
MTLKTTKKIIETKVCNKIDQTDTLLARETKRKKEVVSYQHQEQKTQYHYKPCKHYKMIRACYEQLYSLQSTTYVKCIVCLFVC